MNSVKAKVLRGGSRWKGGRCQRSNHRVSSFRVLWRFVFRCDASSNRYFWREKLKRLRRWL